MTVLRWMFFILFGPSFFAMFSSILRETTLLEIFGISNVNNIVAKYEANKPTSHFPLPFDVRLSPPCHHWCEQGHTYTAHENEKHLWAWLRPHCSCSVGESKRLYDLKKTSFVLIGGGSLIDVWERALKEAGSRHISFLSCHDLGSISGKKSATSNRTTVYLYETCLPEKHEFLDLKPQIQRFAVSVRAVFFLLRPCA